MLGYKRKLFFDLDKAREFGKAVDYIAQEATVPTGKRETPTPLCAARGPQTQHLEGGDFHRIQPEKGARGGDIFYVEYGVYAPNGSSKADVLVAERTITAYLDQKYAELGPDAGLSRG